MTDSTDELLSLLKSQEQAPIASEPGRVLKRPDWLWPFANAEMARKDRCASPLLPRHLRMVRFASFTPDDAGIEAWESEARKIAAYQKTLAPIGDDGADEEPKREEHGGALHTFETAAVADDEPERAKDRVRGVAFALPTLKRR
jgi:hypothetical protein